VLLSVIISSGRGNKLIEKRKVREAKKVELATHTDDSLREIEDTKLGGETRH